MLAEKIRRKLDQADLDEATRYELHTRLESMPRGNRLCHGDLVPANVVLRPGGSIAVLDWSHAAQGDPAADAAQTSLLWRLAGSDETAGAYLELFSDRSGIARRSVEAWMPLVAAAQSPRCRGRERRTLLDWAQVVDYV
jgi:aminoglycoside phosphotransferase (APT) family kinase protein